MTSDLTQPTLSRTYTIVDGISYLTQEEWSLNGLLHRIDEPALRRWKMVNGVSVLRVEKWCLNGKAHRIGAPAIISYVRDDIGGITTYKLWRQNGLNHRTDGSAFEGWYQPPPTGDDLPAVKIISGWYLNDIKIHPRILRQPVRTIERWWKFQKQRRTKAIENLLWDSGMTVFPGFMGLLEGY